jgi:ABC-type polysaccharide/polyol phosphate transport system ATPase subunit
MVSLAVDSVSLTYPLYARARFHGHVETQPHDERIILSPKGDILGVRALEGVSVSLQSGDRLGLVGSNGSGKTTLLQIMAGIITPDAGSVRVSGRCTNLINLSLGMQHEASGHRNITLKGLAYGWSRKEIESRRRQIAEFSELGEFLHMPVETYSAGMSMRLSFAIATAFDPEILILDEWISAGDAAFRQKATDRMQNFVAKAGILVLASHDRDLLLENCNRALWLEHGRVKEAGVLPDVLDAYEQDALRRR